MDDIRQEMFNEWPTLKLNKRFKQTLLKQEIWNTRQGIYGLSDLEKWNSIAFPEVKLFAENHCQGWKIEYFPKGEDHLIQKRRNISIRCSVYSQRIHCWLVAERFLVWQPKNGGVLGPKAAPEYYNIATCIRKHH